MNAAPAVARGPGGVIEPGTRTVVVTGASGFVGRRLLGALAGSGTWTVALTRRHCDLPARLELPVPLLGTVARDVIEDADQVVHLAGGLRPEGGSHWDANVGTAQAVAAAVRAGRARRVVFLSAIGADVASANAYLRTKAEAERVLADTGRELVVFRASHIVGPPDDPGPLSEALGPRRDGSILVPGDGRQRMAPVFVDDVVRALMSALRGGPAGSFELAGPDEMPLDELVALINRPPLHLRHVPANVARLAAHFLPALPSAAVDLMLRPCAGDPGPAEKAFGFKVHSLRRVWTPGR